jgi:hypothetical protein
MCQGLFNGLRHLPVTRAMVADHVVSQLKQQTGVANQAGHVGGLARPRKAGSNRDHCALCQYDTRYHWH